MKLRIMLATAIGAVATILLPPVSAAAPSDTDLLCGFTAVTNPDPEAPDNQQFGEMDGGPIAQNGTITCTIQVGANDLHAETDATGASASGSNGVTVLSPQTITFQAEPLENVYLCDQFRDSGSTVYQFDDVDGAWEVANGTQTCRLAISASTEDPLIQGIVEAIDGVVRPIVDVICNVSDSEQCPPYVCPLLGICCANDPYRALCGLLVPVSLTGAPGW